MDNLKSMEKDAEEQALKKLEESKEMIKLKQQLARTQDRINRLKKKETEKQRRERNHRLIFLGANIEKFWGGPIAEGSKEMAALIHYLPQIKKLLDEGKFDAKWEELQKK